MKFIKIKNLKNFIIQKNASFKEILKILQKSGKKIVIVVNNKKYIGTITDGDIRKKLLLNSNLEKLCAEDFVNKNSLSVLNESEIFTEKVKKKIIDKNIESIPIVNKNKKLISILTKNLEKTGNIPFFIMAGGKGKRLLPLTKNTPKPMLKWNKKPIIENIIYDAKKFGFEDFFISVCYKKHKIINFLKDGKNLKTNISYIEEKKPLGTAGSLSMIPKDIEKILVSNSDYYSNINYKKLVEYNNKTKADITLAVKKFKNIFKYGEVKLNKSIVRELVEKPERDYKSNLGIYIISNSVLNLLKKNIKIEMNDLISKAIDLKFKVNAYPVFEDWIDLGTFENLKK